MVSKTISGLEVVLLMPLAETILAETILDEFSFHCASLRTQKEWKLSYTVVSYQNEMKMFLI